MNKVVKSINLLIDFLSDVNHSVKLSEVTEQDVIVLLGNSSLEVLDSAMFFFNQSQIRRFIISGGIGHSTSYLISNIKDHSIFNIIFNDSISIRSEAEIFKVIIDKFYSVEKGKRILLETSSTNTGENAVFTLALILKEKIEFKNIIIFEDPILQRRARATFEKNFYSSKVFSFTSFVPKVCYKNNSINYINQNHEKFCSIDRLFELISGEIPRLINDSNGYGPLGKNFISHVEIPKEVVEAFDLFRLKFPEYSR